MKFYVYIHKKATDGTVFYVGKGSGRRSHELKRRSEHWKRIAQKHGVEVEILQTDLSEDAAFKLEIETIAKFGRENLCNKTSGGEGLSGLVFSDEHKRKIGSAHKGKKKSPESIEKMVQSLTGRKLSNKHKLSLSISHKGKKKTPEHIRKIAQARIGKAHTDEGKLNIRKAKCKMVICVETGQMFFGTHHAVEWIKQTNIKASQAAIARACVKPTKIAYGYHWGYQ